jgi:hypothetical protein
MPGSTSETNHGTMSLAPGFIPGNQGAFCMRACAGRPLLWIEPLNIQYRTQISNEGAFVLRRDLIHQIPMRDLINQVPTSSRDTYRILIRTGFTSQIFSAYSWIDLSDENFPIRATFRIDIFVHNS